MITEITSKNNTNIKYVKKIISCSKTRKQENLFAIDGTKLLEEALKNNIKIKKIFYTQKYLDKNILLINKIRNNYKIEEFLISEDIMNNISEVETPQGIISVCEFINKNINTNNLDLYNKIIFLDNIQNPMNLGSIFRSLDAFGINLVILNTQSCDIYNPKVLRSSMGSIFRLNIIFENNLNILKSLKSRNFKIFATVPDTNSKNINILSKYNKLVVIVGNEGNGVSPEVMNICEGTVTIPMKNNCESLNVSVATGIVAWEMTK